MPEIPQTANDIPREQTELVKRACLYVASKLDELMREVRVVGGIVPSLLVPPDESTMGFVPHAGTMDLDLGLALALIDEGRFHQFSERLREAGFTQDQNVAGDLTKQRWRIVGPMGETVTVDFLVPSEGDAVGTERDLEPDFAAFVTPGLSLAFRDFEEVVIDDATILGEPARRTIWTCGPGAFVVLKALAFESRGFRKDAYDLYYVARYYGSGVEEVAHRLAPLMSDESARRAVEVLTEKFLSPDDEGPRDVADFLPLYPREETTADVVGHVERLLSLVGAI